MEQLSISKLFLHIPGIFNTTESPAMEQGIKRFIKTIRANK